MAYINDAPTHAGFTASCALSARDDLCVEMDGEGPSPEGMRADSRGPRAGLLRAFLLHCTDGHNPGGFSFSQQRREAVLEVARDEGILIVEDAPYLYTSRHHKIVPSRF